MQGQGMREREVLEELVRIPEDTLSLSTVFMSFEFFESTFSSMIDTLRVL